MRMKLGLAGAESLKNKGIILEVKLLGKSNLDEMYC